MKKIIILLSFFSFLHSADFYQFTNIVATIIDKNIYLDKDVENYNINIEFAPKTAEPKELIKLYKMILDDNNMTLVHEKTIDEDFYYVKYKIPKAPLEKSYYTYKVQNLLIKDISTLLTIFPKLEYKLLVQSDTVVFHSTKIQSKKILQLLSTADLKSEQKQIKITILNTNNLKAKEHGTKINKIGVDFDHFLNLLIGTPIRTSSTISNIGSFNAFLTFMNNEGLTNIEQSPTMLLRDGQKTEFKSVTNIPFLSQTQEIRDTTTNNVESLEYKDVGLTVSIVPKIKNGFIYLDLKLISEDLLTSRENIRPVTQKIEYRNSIKLLENESILLTGLRKKSLKKTGFKVPILGDIPILDVLFDYSSESEELENISILIESI